MISLVFVMFNLANPLEDSLKMYAHDVSEVCHVSVRK